jgi:hypothetical protein
MNNDKHREANRKWASELRKNKKRLRIRIEGTQYKYQDIYIEMSPEEVETRVEKRNAMQELNQKKCVYCTQLVDSDYHMLHPCQRYEIMWILFHEQNLNEGWELGSSDSPKV